MNEDLGVSASEIDSIKEQMHQICEEERAAVCGDAKKPSSEPEQIDSKFVLDSLYKNEIGDSELFVKLYKNLIIYDHALGSWFYFIGQYWQEDLTEGVLHLVQEVTKYYDQARFDQFESRTAAEVAGNKDEAKGHEKIQESLAQRVKYLRTLSRSKKVLELARAGDYRNGGLGFTGEQWDTNPMLLGCLDGVIDLRTGQILKGEPDHFIKSVSPTHWKGLQEPCPNFEAFMQATFDDEEVVSYLQRLLGYCITGNNSEDKFIIFEGRGRNGKTTLLELIGYVLGPLAGPIDSEMLLDQSRSRSSGAPSPDLMNLRGKRLVWASESDDGRRLSVAKVKALSSKDSIIARPPHGTRMVTFAPTHKLILSTNHLPRVPSASDDYALWRRLLLIRFPFSFVDDPQEARERQAKKNLTDELKAEASGILAWLVRGCLEWALYGIDDFPKTVKAALSEYESEEDTIGQFIREKCLLEESVSSRVSDLYDAYTEWCNETGYHKISPNKFGRTLSKRFTKTTSPWTVYRGIKPMSLMQ